MDLARNLAQLRQELEELQDLLRRAGNPPSPQDFDSLMSLLAATLDRLERVETRLSERVIELDRRLLAIEYSRFFQLLQLPGRWLLDWRGLGRRQQ